MTLPNLIDTYQLHQKYQCASYPLLIFYRPGKALLMDGI